MKKPLLPKIKVKITGKEDNFLSILNRVDVAMEKAKIPLDIRKKYIREAGSKWDYQHMIDTTKKWVKTS